jgi:hypothetical protein
MAAAKPAPSDSGCPVAHNAMRPGASSNASQSSSGVRYRVSMLSWLAKSITWPGSASGCSGDPSRISSPSPRSSPGQSISPRPICAAVTAQARILLADWQARVNDARRRIGKTVTLGTTEFTVRFVGTAWQRVAAEFAAREIELNMVHVRTKDSFARLDAKEIDLLCGGFASAAGAGDIPGDYEFLQWRREGLVLLTNLPQRELPVPAVSVDRLPGVPLIVPAAGGVITDFLRRWYGSDFRSRLTIIATIDDIYYGLALMRSKMAYGCMLTSASIARAAVEGRLPGGPGLRTVSLGPDFCPMMELVTGTFARRGERTAFGRSHPLNLLWQAFADEVASGDPYSL